MSWSEVTVGHYSTKEHSRFRIRIRASSREITPDLHRWQLPRRRVALTFTYYCLPTPRTRSWEPGTGWELGSAVAKPFPSHHHGYVTVMVIVLARPCRCDPVLADCWHGSVCRSFFCCRATRQRGIWVRRASLIRQRLSLTALMDW